MPLTAARLAGLPSCCSSRSGLLGLHVGRRAYRRSTRDVTLERRGFVHCSLFHQLRGVAEQVYADADDRVVLVIDMLIAIISPFLDAPMPQPG